MCYCREEQILGASKDIPCLWSEKVVLSVALWQHLEKALLFYSPEVHICGEQTDKINKQRKRVERRWTDKNNRTSRRFYPVRIAITALWAVVGWQFTVCIEGEENF